MLGTEASQVGAVERRPRVRDEPFPEAYTFLEIRKADRDREEKREMIEEAARVARAHDQEPDTIWTDGSKLESGGVGGAVVWYDKEGEGGRHRIHHGYRDISPSTEEERSVSELEKRAGENLQGQAEVVPRCRSRMEEYRLQHEPRPRGV